jgi:myo-inositol-1(or 4)-monophosphatase
LDLAYTASGVFDGFWEHRLAPWDIAAGILLVEEAGGKVTDFQGNPIELGDRHQRISILAASRTLHSSILGKLA